MRFLYLTAFGLAILAVSSACGSEGGPNPVATTTTIPVSTINIVGQNGTQAFSPNPASFGGQMVAFKNNDSITHRVTLNDGSVDSGDIAPGATSRAIQMPTTGTNYHCFIHQGMIGSVAATSGGAPPCEGIYCNAY